MHIAERSLFLAISRLLWAFEFEPGEDEQWKVLPEGLIWKEYDNAAKTA
jgi:hypothetical protein